MLYIYMLGYDVDFGHMEAVSLISAPKYPEKQVISSFHINLKTTSLEFGYLPFSLHLWQNGLQF